MSYKVSLKELNILLSQVEGFSVPKLYFEQYLTPPHIAANIITFIDEEYKDIGGKYLLDLGTGTGMLGIGCSYLGAYSCGVDISQDAINVAKKNSIQLDVINFDCICSDVSKVRRYFTQNIFETVLMNPPFGTKDRPYIDIQFLEAAITLCSDSIYSLHKRTTRKHILNYGDSKNLNTDIIAEISFNIPHTYAFHKKKTVDIDVDLVKFELRI